jgi:endonuclease YncB( thermonuclease family)
MKKRSLFLLPLALVSALTVLFSSQPVDYQDVIARKVIDGDTIELGNGQDVRYIGIDCPETQRNTPSGWRKVHEPFADEAKKLNEELVSGKPLRFEFDVQKKDKYNRLLAYCFVKEGQKEVFVQSELLKKGLAYLYTFPPNIKYVDVLVASLQEAKNKKAGIWSLDLNIDSRKASKFIGERKLVSGKIKKTRSTPKTIRLVMDGLLIVIFKNDLGLFEKASIDPAQFYKGKTVNVFGLIKEYQGEPEIIVSNPWQIEVIKN